MSLESLFWSLEMATRPLLQNFAGLQELLDCKLLHSSSVVHQLFILHQRTDIPLEPDELLYLLLREVVLLPFLLYSRL